jgi:hypothetical protein
MNPKSRAGEAVPRRKIPAAIEAQHLGRTPVDLTDYAMDLLRVVAAALTTPDQTALDKTDVVSAGYVTMYALEALRKAHPLIEELETRAGQ